MNPLEHHIREQIRVRGPVRFVDFMEQALYHPEYGYYSNPQRPIGREGDFYTNVSVGSLFGQLIGQQFAEMWEHLGRPSPFVIVEQGAHTGQFCADVLGWMAQFSPELFAATTYLFLEPKPHYQQKQRETVTARGIDAGKLLWADDWTQVEDGSVTGVVFSNELLDAMPVHRVQYKVDSWHEQYVNFEHNKFVFENGPISDPALVETIRHLPTMHIQRYTSEINLNMGHWIRNVGRALSRGFVFTIDYGYPASLYYNGSRVDGTLTCYYKHKRRYNPLDLVGEQDITAHVDFTALERYGNEAGLAKAGYTDQHHFMVGIAHDDLAGFESHTPESLGMTQDQHRKMIRAFKTLMHPEIMGSTFKYFVQMKGFDSVPFLSGWQFARKEE
ncbi:MAG: SAM-dependent methyltransferase [Verrucomicrobiae bacterium]|nr:SAM-dependent methyltransferase [Verrucomicrobiae bacterium]